MDYKSNLRHVHDNDVTTNTLNIMNDNSYKTSQEAILIVNVLAIIYYAIVLGFLTTLAHMYVVISSKIHVYFGF